MGRGRGADVLKHVVCIGRLRSHRSRQFPSIPLITSARSLLSGVHFRYRLPGVGTIDNDS